MSGEHIWVTSSFIFASGKCGIWPLAAPKNQGFVKLRISRGRERPRRKDAYLKTYGGGRKLLSMLGERNYFLLWELLVWGKWIFDLWMVTIDKEDHSVFPYGLMVRLGGEQDKWNWLFFSMVGWNVVVPFVFQHQVSDMYLSLYSFVNVIFMVMLIGWMC